VHDVVGTDEDRRIAAPPLEPAPEALVSALHH
jgi:hypothetical protein